MRRVFAGMIVLLVMVLAGCGEDPLIQPSQSAADSKPSATAQIEDVDGDEIIKPLQPNQSVSDIRLNARDCVLGFTLGVPEEWTLAEDSSQSFVMRDRDQGELAVEKAAGLAGKSQEEIVREYVEMLQGDGVGNVDAAQELSIGGHSAVGFLYLSEDETRDVSRFLIQDGNRVYDFQFSCSVDDTLDFYVYMDAILQSLKIGA